MSDGTGIAWSDMTANIINGCEHDGPDCINCYAERLSATRLKNVPQYEGVARMNNFGQARWTKHVRFNRGALEEVIRKKRSRKIFVNAMGDTFFKNVPDEWIDEIYAMMVLCPQHIFQMLTKRTERRLAYLTDPKMPQRVMAAAHRIHTEMNLKTPFPMETTFPLPNVWEGTSAGDQATLEKRILHHMLTPAALRWLSLEPMFGSISLKRIKIEAIGVLNLVKKELLKRDDVLPPVYDAYKSMAKDIGWVVLGGESGWNPRPMHPAWAEQIMEECVEGNIPFFFKQWGEYKPDFHPEGKSFLSFGPFGLDCAPISREKANLLAKNPETKAAGLRIMSLIGTKKAGDLLNGVRYQAFPEVHA